MQPVQASPQNPSITPLELHTPPTEGAASLPPFLSSRQVLERNTHSMPSMRPFVQQVVQGMAQRPLSTTPFQERSPTSSEGTVGSQHPLPVEEKKRQHEKEKPTERQAYQKHPARSSLDDEDELQSQEESDADEEFRTLPAFAQQKVDLFKDKVELEGGVRWLRSEIVRFDEYATQLAQPTINPLDRMYIATSVHLLSTATTEELRQAVENKKAALRQEFLAVQRMQASVSHDLTLDLELGTLSLEGPRQRSPSPVEDERIR